MQRGTVRECAHLNLSAGGREEKILQRLCPYKGHLWHLHANSLYSHREMTSSLDLTPKHAHHIVRSISLCPQTLLKLICGSLSDQSPQVKNKKSCFFKREASVYTTG